MQGFSFEDLCALNLNNHRKADLRKSGIVQFREAIACIMTSLINTIPSTVNYSIDKDEIMLKLYTLNRKTRVKHCFKSFHLSYIFFVKWGIHVNVKIMIVMQQICSPWKRRGSWHLFFCIWFSPFPVNWVGIDIIFKVLR